MALSKSQQFKRTAFLFRRPYAVFIYYFNCISFAIRLSGRKVAIKLIDRLIDLDFCNN